VNSSKIELLSRPEPILVRSNQVEPSVEQWQTSLPRIENSTLTFISAGLKSKSLATYYRDRIDSALRPEKGLDNWDIPSGRTESNAQIVAEILSMAVDVPKAHVARNECGEFVFTWWVGSRTLEIYVGENAISYVRMDDPATLADVEGEEIRMGEIVDLLRWVVG